MKTVATFESVWALLQEIAQSQKETDRQIKESRAEYERQMQESRADYEKRLKDSEKRMKIFEDTMGGWSNSHGKFAEDYFFNSFENGQKNFFGKKFNEIEKNLKGHSIKGLKDEYDIVMFNDISWFGIHGFSGSSGTGMYQERHCRYQTSGRHNSDQ